MDDAALLQNAMLVGQPGTDGQILLDQRQSHLGPGEPAAKGKGTSHWHPLCLPSPINDYDADHFPCATAQAVVPAQASRREPPRHKTMTATGSGDFET